MHNSLEVFLDVSALGDSYRYNQKAGIFRYTLNLAVGLANSENCHLSLCAGESFDLLAWTKSYLKTNGDDELRACGFSTSKSVEEQFDGIVNYINKIEAISSFLSKKGITRTKKVKDFLIGLRSPKRDLVGLNGRETQCIYHSAYYPAPADLTNNFVSKFITIHDLIPIIYPDFFVPSVREKFSIIIRSLQKSSWIICNSESTKNDLLKYRPDISGQRIFVTHLAASNSFHPNASVDSVIKTKLKYGIPQNSLYFLSLSTLEVRKNIPHLIRAFINLISQESMGDLCLVLAGRKGWLEHGIYDEINRLPSADKSRIIFTGYVEDVDLAALYKGSMAFVYPSLYEGFGLPPLEAMQCGVPVITSNRSSLPEVVGEAGILIDPNDLDALSQSMLTMYSDAELRSSLSKASLEQATKFSWENCIKSTLSAYKYALEI